MMNRRVFLGGASALLAVGAARSAETIAPEVEVRAEDLRIQRLSWAGLELGLGGERGALGGAAEGGVRAEDLRIQRLSWAGLKLELGEQTVLLDAWTSAGIWDGAWRDPVVGVGGAA